MNFRAHPTSFVCSQIQLTALSLCECTSVFCSVLWRIYVGRIYSSITKILKLDWPIEVTWKRWEIVNQICLRKQSSFEHIRWTDSKWKMRNTPAVTFSCPWRWWWFIFPWQIIIVLFWVIIYSYLQKLFKIGVLRTLHNSQENTCVGVSF